MQKDENQLITKLDVYAEKGIDTEAKIFFLHKHP
jgi:hypothetical protein